MVSFVKSKNPNVLDIEEIAKQFIEVGNKYNIRGDIAFCQSIIETGWFKFDGGTAVNAKQYNYCGLGVVSKGVKGAAFRNVKEGVTAQIQHLFAYATKENIPAGEIIVDPRFKYVTRGIAPKWEDLSNRWAMNPNYGTHILSIYNQMLSFSKGANEVNTNVNNTQVKTEVKSASKIEPKNEVKTENKKVSEKKDFLQTKTIINDKSYSSVIVNGKGYVSVSEIASLFNLKAVLDTKTMEIIFIKK